ncbi:sulfite exporter TauE/SafE family protein [Pollutimonas sp. H1-120]|uniref:sulfite exporter TauE/SafE family protein n=1 Tax=Pollutimonas sp. H1-120 TaxID=3148824 RepID=UPI003B52D571
MITHLLAVLCGGLVGFSLALTGGGGSTLAIPLLLYVVGLHDIHLAIGTSALAVSLNAYINLIPHARAGHVRWRAGIIFTVAGITGAFVGSEVGKGVNGQALQALFAVLVIVVALLMLRRCKASEECEPNDQAIKYINGRLSCVGLGAGAMAGFFGVGGGFLVVPGLMLAARVKIIDAIGTSLLGVGGFGLATAFNYARSDLIDWTLAGEFLFGGIVGGWLGAMLAQQLSVKNGVLNWIFSALLITIGIYMLVKTVRL